MHCHLVHDLLKNTSSIIFYSILLKQEGEFSGDFAGRTFVHIDNSICHNDRKVTDEFDNLKLDRIPHLPYSQDLSPCDFWSFGMLKQKIKDRMFQTVE
jgi:hypothetical protein